MNWVIPVGLGVAIAAVVIATQKDKPKLSRVADNTRFRSRSPGQPQPTSYNVDPRFRQVTFG